MRARGIAIVILGGAMIAGCSADPTVSNTGYEGVWMRGNSRNTSMIAIRKGEDGYRFRWTAWSLDGSWQVKCDWDGRCRELVDGVPVAERTFRTHVDPASGHLFVEGTTTSLVPDGRSATFVDELEVEPDGRTLWSYTVERDGQSTGADRDSRPKRSLRKVSDDADYRPSD